MISKGLELNLDEILKTMNNQFKPVIEKDNGGKFRMKVVSDWKNLKLEDM
jgi:hypothetical protein